MLKKTIPVIIMIFTVNSMALAQVQNYFVNKASFSSEKFDEFSPVYYRNGIVFCSNRSSGLFSGYTTSKNKSFFKLNYIDTAGKKQWDESVPLAGSVNSNLNNGPATFNRRGDTVYFSRNLIVEGNYKEITGTGNKLGLFYSVLSGGVWSEGRELRFNDNSYNVSTPYLSADGKKLFFASDKPEGYGGSDLYFSEWKSGYWGNPVNLGTVINTRGNEAYPFVSEAGDLFFSSDSIPGKGGKDIFFTRYADTAWTKPVGLNVPVNSAKDDFGFIANSTFSNGFFSSNRDELYDIYSFTTIHPQFFYCEEQKQGDYCFSMADDASLDIDPLNLQFRWDFGDGQSAAGYVVEHCYPGPGTYIIKENITDKKRGTVVFNKITLELVIKENELPLITSDDFVNPGEEIPFTVRNETAGQEIISCAWDFGDNRIAKGLSVSHAFRENGDYPVRIAANMKELSTGIIRQVCVSKRITVGQGAAVNDKMAKPSERKTFKRVEEAKDNTSLRKVYSVKDAIAEKAVFQVQISSSPTKIPRANMTGKLKSKYSVRSYFLKDSTYSYVIDEQLTFMAAYPALLDAISIGFRDAKIVTYIPSDAVEKDLWNLKRVYGLGSDLFFPDNDFKLIARENQILDLLVLIMKRNPDSRIAVMTHTNESGSPDADLALTKKQAQSIADYLVANGISKNRLAADGHGSERPVAANYPESERKKNRRIDFVKLND